MLGWISVVYFHERSLSQKGSNPVIQIYDLYCIGQIAPSITYRLWEPKNPWILSSVSYLYTVSWLNTYLYKKHNMVSYIYWEFTKKEF